MTVAIQKVDNYNFNIINAETEDILVEGWSSKKICLEHCKDKGWKVN